MLFCVIEPIKMSLKPNAALFTFHPAQKFKSNGIKLYSNQDMSRLCVFFIELSIDNATKKLFFTFPHIQRAKSSPFSTHPRKTILGKKHSEQVQIKNFIDLFIHTQEEKKVQKMMSSYSEYF